MGTNPEAGYRQQDKHASESQLSLLAGHTSGLKPLRPGRSNPANWPRLWPYPGSADNEPAKHPGHNTRGYYEENNISWLLQLLPENLPTKGLYHHLSLSHCIYRLLLREFPSSPEETDWVQ